MTGTGTGNLIIGRCVGEQIVIGGTVVLTIISAANDRVRISIEAPREIRVDRMEIHKLRKEAESK